ncbi:MAG: carbohydrate-binding domain-containing protein [Arachnia propionica]|uniref:carbohydrate-binding domain-containing protein n=1 Tax=Arachnia propionica TaxID=1750 RepID=UPI002706CB46|nr:carbohydrate-binding domain-containing protein [Arachnia propionica]
MNTTLRLGLASLALAAGLVGCQASTSDTTTASTSGAGRSIVQTDSTTSGNDQLTSLLAANQESHHTAEDATWDEASVVEVTLDGTTATTSGSGVEIAESDVTITTGGTYRLTGSFSGQITVAADGQDVQLILDGVDLDNPEGSPLVVSTADEVTVILAAGSTNTVGDATGYTDTSETAPSSAIDSASDLTITGSGTLKVVGNHNDAINSADGLVIAGGTIEVTAVDDGIRGKDYVVIEGGTVVVEAAGDGVKADNDTDTERGFVLLSGGELTVNAGDDGIKGFTDVAISDATVTVTGSVEAMEAQTIVIAGGEIALTSSDDGVNISGDAPTGLFVAGGSLTIDAAGDGIDSNATATISGGSVVVHGPVDDGNAAIDVQEGLVMTGGELWALGSAGMAETPTKESTQGFVFTELAGSTTGEVSILDSQGTVIATESSLKQYASVLYSGPGISPDGTYRVSLDGTVVGSVAANQYRSGMQGPGGGPGGPGGDRP